MAVAGHIELEPAMRRHIASLRLTTPQSRRSAAHLALTTTGYVAAAFLAVSADTPLLARLLLWFVMAWILIGNGAAVHETLHGHLFSASVTNRIVGVLCGMTIGIPFSLFRAFHLGHHQHAVTADDPEGGPYVFPTRWTYLAVPLGGLLFAGQFVWWTLACVVRRAPVFVRSDRQRRQVVVDGLLGVLFYAAMVGWAIVDFRTMATIWLVPWLVAVGILEPFVLIPEHYGAVEADARSALRITRTIESNALLRWVYWANNLHTAHHVAPGVVPQQINRVSRDLVQPHLDPTWVATGYLRWHWHTLCSLPWRRRRA